MYFMLSKKYICVGKILELLVDKVLRNDMGYIIVVQNSFLIRYVTKNSYYFISLETIILISTQNLEDTTSRQRTVMRIYTQVSKIYKYKII